MDMRRPEYFKAHPGWSTITGPLTEWHKGLITVLGEVITHVFMQSQSPDSIVPFRWKVLHSLHSEQKNVSTRMTCWKMRNNFPSASLRASQEKRLMLHINITSISLFYPPPLSVFSSFFFLPWDWLDFPSHYIWDHQCFLDAINLQWLQTSTQSVYSNGFLACVILFPILYFSQTDFYVPNVKLTQLSVNRNI